MTSKKRRKYISYQIKPNWSGRLDLVSSKNKKICKSAFNKKKIEAHGNGRERSNLVERDENNGEKEKDEMKIIMICRLPL